jgi:hypothetical protein
MSRSDICAVLGSGTRRVPNRVTGLQGATLDMQVQGGSSKGRYPDRPRWTLGMMTWTRKRMYRLCRRSPQTRCGRRGRDEVNDEESDRQAATDRSRLPGHQHYSVVPISWSRRCGGADCMQCRRSREAFSIFTSMHIAKSSVLFMSAPFSCIPSNVFEPLEAMRFANACIEFWCWPMVLANGFANSVRVGNTIQTADCSLQPLRGQTLSWSITSR